MDPSLPTVYLQSVVRQNSESTPEGDTLIGLIMIAVIKMRLGGSHTPHLLNLNDLGRIHISFFISLSLHLFLTLSHSVTVTHPLSCCQLLNLTISSIFPSSPLPLSLVRQL